MNQRRRGKGMLVSAWSGATSGTGEVNAKTGGFGSGHGPAHGVLIGSGYRPAHGVFVGPNARGVFAGAGYACGVTLGLGG